jgi:hypothetical protein
MSRGYGLMLAGLATDLFLGGMMISGAIFGVASSRTGWCFRRARIDGEVRIAMESTAGVFALMLFGGKAWWDFEIVTTATTSSTNRCLCRLRCASNASNRFSRIKVDASARRGRWTPLIPDHGKMMHLFLIRDGGQNAFAHSASSAAKHDGI